MTTTEMNDLKSQLLGLTKWQLRRELARAEALRMAKPGQGYDRMVNAIRVELEGREVLPRLLINLK